MLSRCNVILANRYIREKKVNSSSCINKKTHWYRKDFPWYQVFKVKSDFVHSFQSTFLIDCTINLLTWKIKCLRWSKKKMALCLGISALFIVEHWINECCKCSYSTSVFVCIYKWLYMLTRCMVSYISSS